jgi:2,3-bisphosphoglycerate-dependent phosphoglycerate mutase
MTKIVLLRHGESIWNKKGLFTGWTDVDLSDLGKKQAKFAGEKLKKNKFEFDLVYSSYLKRVIKTAHISLDVLDLLYLPIIKDWRLNERHYGNLQGLNKAQTVKKFGKEQVLLWRRSYKTRPPEIKKNHKFNQDKNRAYKNIKVPKAESLADVVVRVKNFWHEEIIPKLKENKKIIIFGSGNSLRALVKYLNNINEQEIVSLNIPLGIPLVYEFDKKLKVKKNYYLASKKELKEATDKTKKAGSTR